MVIEIVKCLTRNYFCFSLFVKRLTYIKVPLSSVYHISCVLQKATNWKNFSKKLVNLGKKFFKKETLNFKVKGAIIIIHLLNNHLKYCIKFLNATD